MGSILTCMINRPELIEDALLGEREVLGELDLQQADGWGVGFYQAGEVLHKKRPQPSDAPGDWNTVMQGVRSHIFLAQVRHTQDGVRTAANTQPFRMRQWLFAHAGELDGFASVRPAILESLPDFVRRNIRGDTDSEHIFHLLLSFIHDSGHLDSNDPPDSAILGAIRSTVTLVDRLANEVGAPPGTLNLCLTNGRKVHVLRRGDPMIVLERDRLPLGAEDGGPRRSSNDAVRYAIIASVAEEGHPRDCRPLPQGTLVTLDRDLQATEQPL